MSIRRDIDAIRHDLDAIAPRPVPPATPPTPDERCRAIEVILRSSETTPDDYRAMLESGEEFGAIIGHPELAEKILALYDAAGRELPSGDRWPDEDDVGDVPLIVVGPTGPAPIPLREAMARDADVLSDDVLPL